MRNSYRRRSGARRSYQHRAAAAGSEGAGSEGRGAVDRSAWTIPRAGGGLPEVRPPHMAGPPVASAAKAGRPALEEGRLAGAPQAPLPLPELPQGVHGARPSLRGEKADNGKAEGDGRGLGE